MKKVMKKVSLLALFTLAVSNVALAADGGAGSGTGMVGFAAGLAIGLAVLGGALGQGKAVSEFLNATGRNPSASGKMFVPMIIGLALIESLVILSFVIAFFLQGKI